MKLLCLCILTVFAPLASAQDAEPKEAYRALIDEYVAAQKGYLAKTRAFYQTDEYRKLRANRNHAAMRKRMAAFERPAPAYVSRVLALAKRAKGTALEATCFAWVIANGRDKKSTTVAIDGLLARHLDSAQLRGVMARYFDLNVLGREACEKMRQHVIEKCTNRETAASAHFAAYQWGRRGDDAARKQLREKILGDYAGTVAAKNILGDEFRKARLQVGMKAPDIEGEDIDGVTFKMSDYAGKVVMLDFWGDW